MTKISKSSQNCQNFRKTVKQPLKMSKNHKKNRQKSPEIVKKPQKM